MTEKELKSGDGGYFKQWYAKNRKKLLANRRERWKEDPEYRRQNLERKRSSRIKEREEEEKFREEALGSIIRLLESEGFSPITIMKAVSYLPNGARGIPKCFDFGEDAEMLYPMGYLCVRLVRTGQTIRLWHENEVLPEATYIDHQDWRWYSWDYMEACAMAAKNVRDQGPWSLKKFKKELEETVNDTDE